jgi:hypothetical protein
MTKRNPSHPRHTPVRISRRELLGQADLYGGATALAGYAAFAPEQAPLSHQDQSGLRSIPEEPLFTLPDFRVATRMGAGDVGLGRGGAVREHMNKALDAVGGLRHFIQPGDVVLVKPNVAFDRSPNLGATTNP